MHTTCANIAILVLGVVATLKVKIRNRIGLINIIVDFINIIINIKIMTYLNIFISYFILHHYKNFFNDGKYNILGGGA